jgi:hypothetical protein
MRLKQLAEDFQAANERSRTFLTAAFRLETPNNAKPPCLSEPSRLKPNPQEWRDRAERTRVFAEHVSEPRAKRVLLEIAESYDQLVQ